MISATKNNLVLCIILLFIFTSCSDSNTTDPDETSDSICQDQNPIEKGDRLLGLDLLNLTETNTFDQNITLGNDLGIEFIALHLTWNSIEVSPENYQDPFNALELLGQVAVSNDYKFSLTIRPIDLVGKTVPTDLTTTRFNDPIMITRFQSLVDFIFTKLGSSVLLNFQIGNEIDGYNTSDEPISFWEDYKIFLQEATQYLHSIDSDILVGFTATYDGLMRDISRFNSLVEAVDVLGVTYYPLQSDFSVEEPDIVFEDFDKLIDTYGSYPIYIQEIGYQTSEMNNSSESKQAEFYCNVFKAWDLHTEHIKSINILRLNDLSEEEAINAAGPYGLSNDEFIEYLRSLGIRTYENEGQNKQAFEIIKRSMKDRGW